jgi:glycosyltransferase involved in cell wall biosynthesis
MRGVVLSLPELKRRGLHIEVWCWHCDPSLPVDKIVRLPRLGNLRALAGHAFAFWAMLRAWWLFRVLKSDRPDVICTVAWYLPACDVALVQFSPWDWERRQRMLGVRSLRDLYERLANWGSLAWANHAMRHTSVRRTLCVSEAVAADVRARRPELSISLLPNCYDPGQFHAGVGELHRESMRKTLQFSPGEIVFAFASTGHYRRKGFHLAVEALEILRKTHANVRLLVVGGRSKRIEALQRKLGVTHPGWRGWITFTGMVPDVEKYFAAADGFLFPSYSEAFALVEVEAAACGLPLFLTRHHGSEMILEDGVNGRFMDFVAEHIAQVLEEFVSGRWKPSFPQAKRALDKVQYAQRLAAELLSVGNPSTANKEISRAAIPVS